MDKVRQEASRSLVGDVSFKWAQVFASRAYLQYAKTLEERREGERREGSHVEIPRILVGFTYKMVEIPLHCAGLGHIQCPLSLAHTATACLLLVSWLKLL